MLISLTLAKYPIHCVEMLTKIFLFFHRWFAIFYLLFMFIILPAYVMALSFIDEVNQLGVYFGFLPLVILMLLILLINIVQKQRPKYLPEILRNWDFLPEFMHSLKPLDR